MSGLDRGIRCGCAAFVAAILIGAGGAASAQVPGDNNSFRGDHIRLLTNVIGFVPEGGPDTEVRCAPAGSRLSVHDEDKDNLFVRFLAIRGGSMLVPAAAEDATCGGKLVELNAAYKIPRERVQHSDYRRSGVTFGGLVVPFKFRLGKNKELVSSSAVAPYLGFRTAVSTFGLYLTPVVAAGLSIVPVNDPANSTTATKTGYTVAVGIKITSDKNENFNAGLLIGHDYLNKADRLSDPNVSKPWVSLYLGYAM